MSKFIIKDGKKTLPNSIYIKILIFLGLITISIIVLQPIQYALNNEITKIKTNLIEKVKETTGFTVKYSSIRPSIFGSFNINNLIFLKGDASFFTVSQVKVHFSLMELLLRKKTFIHTVIIDKPEFNIDTVKDADTFALLKSLNKNEISFQQIMEFLPNKPDYQIRHLSVNLTDRQTTYKIQDMNLTIKENDGEISFFGRFYAELKKSNLFDKTIILSADTGISGTCSKEIDKGNAELSVYYLTCSEKDEIKKTPAFFKLKSHNSGTQRRLFSLLPLKTTLTYDNSLVSVKPKQEGLQNNYYFVFNTETSGIQAGINLNKLKLENIISFSDNIKNATDMLFLQITGDSSLVYEKGICDYNINLKGDEDGKLSSNKSSFNIDVYGNEKKIIINEFFIASGTPGKDIFCGSLGIAGNLQFSPLVSTGTVYFNNFSLTGTEGVNAEFDISSHDDSILISSGNIEIAQSAIDDFSVLIKPTEKETSVNVSCSFVEGGSVFMDGFYNNSDGIESSITLDSLSLFTMTEILRPFLDNYKVPIATRGMLKNSSINTDIFISTDFNNIIYNAPNINFLFGETNVAMSLSGNNRQITLSEGVINPGDNEFIFSSNVNFSNIMDLSFSLNAGFHDIAWRIEGQILDGSTLIVRDQNGFHAYGNVSNDGALSGYIEGINYPIVVNSQTIYMNFYLSLRYNSFDFWSLDVNNFSTRYASSNDGADFFKISGLADQDGASFREIYYKDAVGILFGSANFSWDHDFSYCDCVLNITDGREAGEYYYVSGTLNKEKINANVSISDMHVNRFFKLDTPIITSLDAAISWDSINSFNAKISLSSLRTRIQNNDLYASVNVNLSNEELFISNLLLDYAKVNTNLSELKFNLTEGEVNAKANINGIVLEKNVEGNIEIDANFEKIDSWFDITQIIRNFSGKLLIDNFTYGNIVNQEFKLDYSVNNGAISLKGGPRDMVRMEMDSDGMFFIGMSAPMFARGNIVGTYKKGIVDAKTNSLFIDLPAIFDIFSAQNDFLITGGYITGSARLTGPFWNPEFHGLAKATGVRFTAPNYISEEIRIAPVEVIAEGYEMTFDSAAVLSGNGGGTASGWFVFENWSPVNIGIDISIPRETPIRYGFNVIGFIAKGSASGNLNMVINPRKNGMMEMKGDLFANEAELSLNMEELMSNNENNTDTEEKFNIVVDMKVTAGSQVEFSWPSSSPILRATPEMGTIVNIKCDTQTDQYSVNGNVKIRSGEVYYFDRSFFIRQGNMVFNENESQFDPRVSLRAEIRDRSDSGPVTITMVVENQPIFSLEPRFEARPSMTQLEIYSILGQNFNSIQGNENPELAQRFLFSSGADLFTQVIANTGFMSQFAFLRKSERAIRNFLKVDMFSVRTKIFQNMVVTAGTFGLNQNGGQDLIDRNRQVGNYFDNTTVFIGKYIGNDLFAQGMLTLKYDEKNQSFGSIRFEPNIGIEFQSPFVNIRWDWSPDIYNIYPENLWVGNSITLSWSKSF